ncbi:hypothetical protein DIPPA_02550 [Diplonema papillatum]|nr:hypothetical protein DIPPA_02550 [Diplonema papillatum]
MTMWCEPHTRASERGTTTRKNGKGEENEAEAKAPDLPECPLPQDVQQVKMVLAVKRLTSDKRNERWQGACDVAAPSPSKRTPSRRSPPAAWWRGSRSCSATRRHPSLLKDAGTKQMLSTQSPASLQCIPNEK